ncbi:hypothetical protein BDZ89DRAFT_1074563 [Hymenopellis radicata]|nr:hypothetical protein BDZ89DRAFT_1074563 [Hymenopellis radicata]
MALLVPANAAGIVPPLAPALPPTVADARLRKNTLIGSPGTATNADVVAAAEYEHSILSHRAGAGKYLALNVIGRSQNYQISRRTSMVSNATNGNGHTYPFDIINFNNNAPVNPGVDPTTIGLPALTSVTAINNLTHAEVNTYCQGYGIAAGGAYRHRKRAIARHIGCHDLGVLL